MRKSLQHKQLLLHVMVVFIFLAVTTMIFAQEEEIKQIVARVCYISGDVSFCRGDSPDDWQPAILNVPLTQGDRMYTALKSKLELQLPRRAMIFLGQESDLCPLQLNEDNKQFSLTAGTATFHVPHLLEEEYYEVATPNASISLEQSGDYRFDVDNDGNTAIYVQHGFAKISAGGEEITLETGMSIHIDGRDNPEFSDQESYDQDNWDHWVDSRLDLMRNARSYQWVQGDIEGVSELDTYGDWSNVPGYGMAWAPHRVDADWRPYRSGHWIWQDPWGWTWLAEEPWGWAPYHYGRWACYSSRWYWIPESRNTRFVRYSPALVAFVGGGRGWSASINIGNNGGGYIGWFPLAPRDQMIPWWGHHRDYYNNTHVTYINQSYVTVINHNTFISGGMVYTNLIHDPVVIRQISSAAVIRGPIPVIPNAGALRAAQFSNTRTIIRPPSSFMKRTVLTRLPPPLPPPLFTSKLSVIRSSQGAPIFNSKDVQFANQGQRFGTTLPLTKQLITNGKPLIRGNRTIIAGNAFSNPANTTNQSQLRSTTKQNSIISSNKSITNANSSNQNSSFNSHTSTTTTTVNPKLNSTSTFNPGLKSNQTTADTRFSNSASTTATTKQNNASSLSNNAQSLHHHEQLNNVNTRKTLSENSTNSQGNTNQSNQNLLNARNQSLLNKNNSTNTATSSNTKNTTTATTINKVNTIKPKPPVKPKDKDDAGIH